MKSTKFKKKNIVKLPYITTPLTMVFTLLTTVLSPIANATCNSSGIDTYRCEETNNAGVIINSTDVAVETDPGFSVNELDINHSALDITGSGTISYTDIHGSILNTTGPYSLAILNDTSSTGQSATTTIKTNGTMSSGILSENFSGANSTLSVEATNILPANPNGNSTIDLGSYAVDNSSITLNSNAISGDIAIQSYNIAANGVANNDIAITGDINASSIGALIDSEAYSDSHVNLSANNITSGSYGLYVDNTSHYGASNTHLTVNGDINVDNSIGTIINNQGNNGSNIVLSTNNITSQSEGVYINNSTQSGILDTDITIAGDINVGDIGVMIYQWGHTGSSELNLRLKDITANYGGIQINNNDETVTTNINADGDIIATNGIGTYVYNQANNGDSNIIFRAHSISAGGYAALMLYNQSQYGVAKTDITLTGDIISSAAEGVSLSANGDGTDTTIRLNNVTASNDGINLYTLVWQQGNSTLDFTANNISADYNALNIQQDNYQSIGDSVFTSVNVTGDIIAELGSGATFKTYSFNTGDATALINLNNVTAYVTGIDIDTFANAGIATTDLTVAGQVNAIDGIILNSKANDGGSMINVDVNNVASYYDAIHIVNNVFNDNTGQSTVNAITRGEIVSQEGTGIAIETNTADTYLTVAGLVQGGNGSAIGLYRLDNSQKSATLELQSGYALVGTTQALFIDRPNLDLNYASLDLQNSHLVLGGDSDSVFDLTRIDNREQAITNGGANRITGFGTLAKTGDSLWRLTGSNMTDGTVNSFLSANVDAGTLALDNATLGLTSDLTPLIIADGATLSSIGASTVIGHVANAGKIQLSNNNIGRNTLFTGDQLTINGNYSGNNASLVLDSQLGNDSSPTDKLLINGDVSGTTTVKVNNVGGTGAQTSTGITLIEVGGVSLNNAFLLQGDYVTADGKQAVIAGAYAYTLQANGQEASAGRNWYLSSALMPVNLGSGGAGNARYQPGIPLYEQYPQVLSALNTQPTLQQRVGNRYWSSSAQGELTSSDVDNGQWAWGHIEGTHQKSDPARSTSGSQRDVDLWKLQTGLDIPLHQSQDDSLLTGGVNFSYGKAKADISSYFGNGSINTSGYGVGTTLTWYGSDGVFVDGQLQTMWFDSDLDSHTLGESMVSGNHGRGYASSVEVGKRYSLGDGLSLTPQTQLIYSRVDFDHFSDSFNNPVSLQDGNSLDSRLGISLDQETTWTANDGTTSGLHVYGSADLYNQLMNGTKINSSNVALSTRDQRESIGIGSGSSYEWQNGRYTVYGNTNLISAAHHVSNNYSIGGDLGVSIGW